MNDLVTRMNRLLATGPTALLDETVVKTHSGWSTLYLLLSSGRVVIIRAEDDYGSQSVVFQNEISVWDDFNPLMELGVLTQEEIDEYHNDRKTEAEEKDKANRRRKYLELKAEFED